MKPAGFLFVAFLVSGWNPADAQSEIEASMKFFEGRWAFVEEACHAPTNWTMLAGGNFVSEDLTGTWEWSGAQLKLRLIDLAIDEETGEAGGRFQMSGPVEIKSTNRFSFTILPDVYEMKRCSG